MTKIFQKWCLAAAAVTILGFAPSALADSTASMTLTSAGSNVVDGIYMGPYSATVNGVKTPVICDDFADESFINESWTANVSTFSNLSGTKFAGQLNSTKGYDEVAWLTLALLNPANASQSGQIQYAIWAVFGGSSVKSYLSSTLSSSAFTSFYTNGVTDWLALASGQTYTANEFANFAIYTPNTNDPITCGRQACANTPPQEFIALVPTPEPGTAALLGIGLLGFGFILRRRLNGVSAN